MRSIGVFVLLLAAAPILAGEPEADPFVVGADVTSFDRLDVRGVAYRTTGPPRAPLGILEEAGFEVLKLRVLVDPPSGYLGAARSATVGARVRGAGFRLYLELSCGSAPEGGSATALPASWREAAASGSLPRAIRTYAQATVEAFRSAGAPPDYIQVGHDVDAGFLGTGGFDREPDATEASGAGWERAAELLRAGIEGAKAAAPRAKIVLHVSGQDPARCAAAIDSLLAHRVAADHVGVTWVPWWQGTRAELREMLDALAAHHAGGVLVTETAYPWTLRGFDRTLDEVSQRSQLHPGYEATPEGQRRWFADLVELVRGHPAGRGVLWGDALSIAARGVGTARENLALFDEHGLALPGLWVLREGGDAAPASED